MKLRGFTAMTENQLCNLGLDVSTRIVDGTMEIWYYGHKISIVFNLDSDGNVIKMKHDYEAININDLVDMLTPLKGGEKS